MTSASVVVSASEFPSRRALAADEHGEFRVDNLPPWDYGVDISAPGFDQAHAEVSVVVGATPWRFRSARQRSRLFETFGDNQFVTPITAFPILRNQQKYQFRYDVTYSMARHAPRFGVNSIHEPVLNGWLANLETIIRYPADPSVYAAAPIQFYFSVTCAPPPPAG